MAPAESSKRNSKRVVYVGDNAGLHNHLTPHFEHEGNRFAVEVATSTATALGEIRDHAPDCVLLDYDTAGQHDTELLERMCDEQPAVPIIVLIGDADRDLGGEAIRAGATDCLDKQLVTEQCDILVNRIQAAVGAQGSERRFSSQEEMMRLAESAGNTGSWKLQLDTETLEITPGYSQLTGLSVEADIPVDDAIDLYHPADQPARRAAAKQAIQSGEQTGGTWRIQPHNGEQRIVDVTIEPVTAGDMVPALRGSIRDVTERHERREEREQIEALFQYTQGPLFLIDVDDEFIIQRVNPAWEDATGVTAERSHGKTIHELLGKKQVRKVETCVEQQAPLEYTEQLQFGDDVTYWETKIAPVVIDGDVEYIAGSTRNITDNRAQQRELRILQQAIDDANMAITLADPSQEDNPIVYVNDAFEELTGYSKAETLGRNCRYLQGENTDDTKIEAIRAAVDGDEPITVELRNYRKDDTEFWNRLSITPIDDDGSIIRYLGTQQDITEPKERQKELQSERAFTQQALDGLDDLFYVLDTDGTIQRWNERAIRVTGYTPTELKGMAGTELFPRSKQQSVSEAIEEMLQEETGSVEAKLRTNGGELIPYEWSGARLTDTEGETIGIVGIGRDISQRRQREQRFQALVERSNDSITVVDADGRFQYQSPSIEHILGYDPNEIVGNSVWEYIHPDDHETAQRWFKSVVRNQNTSETVEYRARHADGSWEWMEASGNDQINNSAVNGYVITSRKITDRKQREQHLGILDRMLRHNFRNDINVIRGRAEIIRSTAPETAAEHAVDITTKSNELLELTKKQRELTSLIRDDLVPRESNLRELLQHSISTVTAVHPDAAVSIDCPADIPITAPAEIEQAIVELVTNAIIHNDDNSPAVSVSATHSGELIHINIADNCPPLPEVEQRILTEALQETPLDHGSGLGLWLVRVITSQMRGTIFLNRNDSGGNTVQIELPQ